MSYAHETLDERQFLLAARRLADTLATGADASPFVGSGVDYAQSRMYVSGDSTRSIDWRVTARTGKTFVKEYEAQKRLPVQLVVDASASMCLTSGARSKFDWALMLAGALALSAVSHQNPVGLISTVANNPALQVRPTLSCDRIQQWLTSMRSVSTVSGAQASVASVLGRPEVSSGERSCLVVLSDLHEATSVGALKRVAQQHDVMALRLTDASETRPIGGGFFRGAEAETGRRFIGSGRRVAATFANYHGQLARAGVDGIELCVEDDFLPRLQSYLKQRARAR